MLQNASLLAIVAVDTEENEPIKNEVWWVRRHFGGPSRGLDAARLARDLRELPVGLGNSTDVLVEVLENGDGVAHLS